MSSRIYEFLFLAMAVSFGVFFGLLFWFSFVFFLNIVLR